MAKVKVGVIGVGSMGENHARIYSTLKEASLVGVIDSDHARAAEIAGKYSCRAFNSIDQLLKEVDAASLVSPTSTHYQLALQCLGNSVHLLVEKPMAPTFSESEALVSAAQKKKCVLAVGMIERFNPAFKKAASLVRHDLILGMEFIRHSPFPSRISDASVVSDMMLHDIDLALSLSRTDVDTLKSSGSKIRTDRLDECSATLYFKDGLIAKLEASRVKSEKKRLAIITSDRSIYEVDLLNKRLFIRSFDAITEKASIDIEAEDQLTLELKDFLHSIARGRPPRVPGADSLAAIKIVEEVERSSC